MSYTKFFALLGFLLLIKAVFIAFGILHAGIGLGPDEAQYWTWSEQLDFGYYSKPPGIAWEIAFGTFLFGNTEFGVRFIPLILGFLFPLFVFFLAKNCKSSPCSCFWAGICSGFAPLGIFASFLAITDTGMILAWTLTWVYVTYTLEQKRDFNWLILGTIIGIGALFKWTMFIAWIAIFGCLLFFPSMRNLKNFKQISIGFLISLLALLPSVYWNSTHEWATFRHVLSTLGGGHGNLQNSIKPSNSHNPLDFIGSQMALVSPILFVLLILAWIKLIKRRREVNPSILFCGILSLTLFTFGLVASFFMKMQGNWIIFAYPTAFVIIAWYGIEVSKKAKPWMIFGCLFSALLSIFVLSIPKIQSTSSFSSIEIPYRISPFRHNVGLENVSDALKSFNYNSKTDFLFSEKYQTSSQLSFYGPGQKRAYFLNLGGARKNQFSFWPGMDQEQIGKKGYFVIIENLPRNLNERDLEQFESDLKEKYLKELSPYFDKVSYLGMRPLFKAYGKPVKNIFVFEGDNYNGKLPKETSLY